MSLKYTALILTLLATSAYPEQASVAVPASILFNVQSAHASTQAGASIVSFQNATLDSGKSLRISVRAQASSMTPPSGSAIPASKISWSVSGVTNGSGSGGTLTALDYIPVYQSAANATSGNVTLHWILAAPGTSGLRAGWHELTLEWRFDSI